MKQLTGRKVSIQGFMAPPLKAEAQFFVLTEIPMALCPFCSTDADWPDNILVVYLDRKQTFTDPNQRIEARGTLERKREGPRPLPWSLHERTAQYVGPRRSSANSTCPSASAAVCRPDATSRLAS